MMGRRGRRPLQQADKLQFILPYLGKFANKKENPPRVFPGRCYKSRFHLYTEALSLLHEILCLGSFAGTLYPQGLAVVETQHHHQAFAVSVAAATGDGHIKTLGRCQEHEIPYILKRVEAHLK